MNARLLTIFFALVGSLPVYGIFLENPGSTEFSAGAFPVLGKRGFQLSGEPDLSAHRKLPGLLRGPQLPEDRHNKNQQLLLEVPSDTDDPLYLFWLMNYIGQGRTQEELYQAYQQLSTEEKQRLIHYWAVFMEGFVDFLLNGPLIPANGDTPESWRQANRIISWDAIRTLDNLRREAHGKEWLQNNAQHLARLVMLFLLKAVMRPPYPDTDNNPKAGQVQKPTAIVRPVPSLQEVPQQAREVCQHHGLESTLLVKGW